MQKKKSGKSSGMGHRGPGVTGVPTWVTEAFVAGAHAAAGAVGAGAERAEVDQLGTGRAREAGTAAAAEAHAVRGAGPIVLARSRGARVHLFFAGRPQVPCGEARAERVGYN